MDFTEKIRIACEVLSEGDSSLTVDDYTSVASADNGVPGDYWSGSGVNQELAMTSFGSWVLFFVFSEVYLLGHFRFSLSSRLARLAALLRKPEIQGDTTHESTVRI
jgi:hypothetical protein